MVYDRECVIFGSARADLCFHFIGSGRSADGEYDSSADGRNEYEG